MKTDALFNEIRKHKNIKLLEVNKNIRNQFESEYSTFQDKLFYEFMQNCGGIIIDNWIRLYGCGELNVIEKNQNIKNDFSLDIVIGEDVIGGLFALRDNVIYYFAPDKLAWECLDIYYAYFMSWILNEPQNVELFYKYFRWRTWKEDCIMLELNQGFSFYPFLFSECNIEERNRKIINIDEIIMLNFELKKKMNI